LLNFEIGGFAADPICRQDGDLFRTWCGTCGALYTGLVEIGQQPGKDSASFEGSRVTRLKSTLIFLLQSIVVGLAAAFIVVLVRPDLMPALGGSINGSPSSYADAVDISAPAVVSVYTKRLVQDSTAPSEKPRFRVDTSFGSAVIIDSDGFLVTNFHVIAESAEIRVQLGDGRIGEAVVVGEDKETDLALLKVNLGQLAAIHLGSSGRLRIGDVVLAIGNPYGLSKSVTQGIISATGRGLLNLNTFENYIQTDAAINAGNSGGALVNSRGELIGINTAVLAQDSGTEGIGFAIPVDLVRGVVEELKLHGRVIRGYMGLFPDDLTNAERTAIGLDDNIGILLISVYDGGPAATAGLLAGDVLLSINDEFILTQRQALLIVAGTSPGDEVDIVVWRNGRRFNTTVVAGERPEDI
jgi:serine peptidase DegS